jgi:hypothetical protein
MDVAAESLPQDTAAAGVEDGQKHNGEAGAHGGAKSEDNKFQKAIAAWRSAYILVRLEQTLTSARHRSYHSDTNAGHCRR